MEKKHQYQGLTKQEVEESRRLHGAVEPEIGLFLFANIF